MYNKKSRLRVYALEGFGNDEMRPLFSRLVRCFLTLLTYRVDLNVLTFKMCERRDLYMTKSRWCHCAPIGFDNDEMHSFFI